ncbi:hypothetical protein [Nostoc sp. LEGE 12447]|nr:hypothetical protein [Nostoc sp. LEGE 12447]
MHRLALTVEKGRKWRVPLWGSKLRVASRRKGREKKERSLFEVRI